MTKIRLKLPADSYYYADEIYQQADKDFYTIVEYKGERATWVEGINNIRKQLFKWTGVSWQFIKINPNDIEWTELE